MNRRKFLKMMAALGAVPSLGMLKPIPKPVPYLGHAWSADFYQINWNNPVYISKYATASLQHEVSQEMLDREIERAMKIINAGVDALGERVISLPRGPEYIFMNDDFLTHVADPDAPSWRVL